MDVREQAFVHEYILNKGNAYKAALKAGYTARTAKHAYQWIENPQLNPTANRKLTFKPYLREAIDAELKKIEDAQIADEVEIMKYLTSVMRKESKSEVVVVEGTGNGFTEARTIDKYPDEKEATKAAEVLAKIHGMFNQTINVDISPVVLEGYEDVPD